jgi:nickel-dependent lactate racemase
MKLKYGKEEIQLILPDKNILQVLNLKEQEVLSNPEEKLKYLLKNPIGSPSLKELIF